jgi:hypothetical protein
LSALWSDLGDPTIAASRTQREANYEIAFFIKSLAHGDTSFGASGAA